MQNKAYKRIAEQVNWGLLNKLERYKRNGSKYNDSAYIIFLIFLGILNIIPMQLLAMYLAQKLGHEVDTPRNLAKSVTV